MSLKNLQGSSSVCRAKGTLQLARALWGGFGLKAIGPC